MDIRRLQALRSPPEGREAGLELRERERHIYIYRYVHIYVCIYIYMYICVCTCLRTCMYGRLRVDTRQVYRPYTARLKADWLFALLAFRSSF